MQEIRNDPTIGDLRMRSRRLLVGAGLADRLDGETGVDERIEPTGERAPRVRDREGTVAGPQFLRRGAERPGLGHRAFGEVVADGDRLARTILTMDPPADP